MGIIINNIFLWDFLHNSICTYITTYISTYAYLRVYNYMYIYIYTLAKRVFIYFYFILCEMRRDETHANFYWVRNGTGILTRLFLIKLRIL